MYNQSNSESKIDKIHLDLEASNQFTLKGDDDIQIDQNQFSGSKIEIESNKKSNVRSNSRRSIKILNLTDFSFRSNEDRFINEEVFYNINKSEEKKEENLPKRRKWKNIIKIKIAKEISSEKKNKFNLFDISSNEIQERGWKSDDDSKRFW